MAMKNYKSWVKQEGSQFIEKVKTDFEADTGEHGGASAEPDFFAWVDEHDLLVRHAREVGEGWSLADVNFVNSNSPNKEDQAVSKDQAIDAFVRDLSRVVKQLWKKR
jgi:hypothetical protein